MQLLHPHQCWDDPVKPKGKQIKIFFIYLNFFPCFHSFCTATSGYGVLCSGTQWWWLLGGVRVPTLNSPRQCEDSNFCPYITEQVSSLWEESTLIKNHSSNFSILLLSLSGSLGYYKSDQKRADDHISELFKLCHWNVWETGAHWALWQLPWPRYAGVFNQLMLHVCTARRTSGAQK